MPHARPGKRKKAPKRVLALPDLEHAKSAVLADARKQSRRLLERPQPATPRELRDHAMLAMLIGCGLRRGELLALTLESVQQREEHWVIADLVGKGGHVRTRNPLIG
jgi:site-specific recombinase XerD